LPGQTLLGQTGPAATRQPRQAPIRRPLFRQVDPRRAAQAGIRQLTGRHLTLYTDVPSSVAVDRLPALFDAAVPQWAEYFHLDQSRLRDWHMQGYLMADRQRFAQLHLLPETNRRFENGYAQGHELWLAEQPSDYYRRHLLLHEGTHGFMWTQLGGCGAPWYMEGMAELFATHRWDGQRLLLSSMPASRVEVPMWGRIKLIQDAYRQGQAPALADVLQLGHRGPMHTAQYAWCWALVKLLDTNPHFQPAFRQLPKFAGRTDFQKHFARLFQAAWPELNLQWRSLVSTLEFGHDFARMAIEQEPVRPLGQQGATRSIATDRGWQSTGWLLRAGQAYQLTSAGRFRIARSPAPPPSPSASHERKKQKKGARAGATIHAALPPAEIWYSEPGGITLQYHAGQPLGKLLAALVPLARVPGSVPAAPPGRPAPAHAGEGLWKPLAVGLAAALTPRQDGALYLRVNESSARLADNLGPIQVTIKQRPPQ